MSVWKLIRVEMCYHCKLSVFLGGNLHIIFYKLGGKPKLTQACTLFLTVLSQLCSALVNNSHPSDSDSAWPKTIFSLQVQFHLTGSILPLMHLTVACTIFSSLYPVFRSCSCLNNFFCISNTSHHSLILLSLFTVLLQLSVDLCL